MHSNTVRSRQQSSIPGMAAKTWHEDLRPFNPKVAESGTMPPTLWPQALAATSDRADSLIRLQTPAEFGVVLSNCASLASVLVEPKPTHVGIPVQCFTRLRICRPRASSLPQSNFQHAEQS